MEQNTMEQNTMEQIIENEEQESIMILKTERNANPSKVLVNQLKYKLEEKITDNYTHLMFLMYHYICYINEKTPYIFHITDINKICNIDVNVQIEILPFMLVLNILSQEIELEPERDDCENIKLFTMSFRELNSKFLTKFDFHFVLVKINKIIQIINKLRFNKFMGRFEYYDKPTLCFSTNKIIKMLNNNTVKLNKKIGNCCICLDKTISKTSCNHCLCIECYGNLNIKYIHDEDCDEIDERIECNQECIQTKICPICRKQI
jgi:hypothetical protein